MLISIVNRTPPVLMGDFTTSRTHISAIVLLRNKRKQHAEILYTHKSSMLPFYGEKNNSSYMRSRTGQGHDEQRRAKTIPTWLVSTDMLSK
jgi:hypothetical protein